ncbi:MAG: hypothetical protein EPN19_06750 [Betaproteobacteria bacterium]|nr:MAG: hypothetical protein EPN19_06750 [Betaproteobacteria bacterium]
MRPLALLEYAALIVGIIAVIAGRFFALAKGVHLGIFLVGAGIALGGLESVFTRRLGFRPADDSGEVYAGAPAVIAGLMALLVGAGVIAAAYVLDARQWDSTLRYLTRRPAPVLAAGGLLLTGIGALMLFNLRGRRGLLWTLLVRAPRALLGLVLVAAGLAAIGLGAWEWREPSAFDQFVRNLQQKFDWPIRIRQPSARASSAATAGSVLPSRNSRNAPPAVEM